MFTWLQSVLSTVARSVVLVLSNSANRQIELFLFIASSQNDIRFFYNQTVTLLNQTTQCSANFTNITDLNNIELGWYWFDTRTPFEGGGENYTNHCSVSVAMFPVCRPCRPMANAQQTVLKMCVAAPNNTYMTNRARMVLRVIQSQRRYAVMNTTPIIWLGQVAVF